MLQHAAAVVAPGGRLSTPPARASRKRTKRSSDAFLATTPAFRAGRRAPGGADACRADVIDARGHLRTEPHRHGLEAFFGAVFVTQRSRGTNLYVPIFVVSRMALRNARLERGQARWCSVGALVATYVLFAAASMRVALARPRGHRFPI